MTPNFTKGRNGFGIKAIVLHITAGSSKSALNWFASPISQVSAHYLVSEDGTVHKLVAESDTAWHCGKLVRPTWSGLIPNENPNQYTIGVELALPDGQLMPSWKQWLAWAKLVKDLKLRYNAELVNHNEIRADKICPGTWGSKFYANLLGNFV